MAAEVGPASVQANDDVPTVCAISLLAEIIANVLHEGLGHAATALLTGAKSGVLTTVAWSSDFDKSGCDRILTNKIAKPPADCPRARANGSHVRSPCSASIVRDRHAIAI
jgi:hypothetical protein